MKSSRNRYTVGGFDEGVDARSKLLKGGRTLITYKYGSCERHCAGGGSGNSTGGTTRETVRSKRRGVAQDIGGKASREQKTGAEVSRLLEWSSRQAHILTGGGRANELYQPPRFPFKQEELPHFHKARDSTHEAFAAWRTKVSFTRLIVWGQEACD